MLERQSAYDHWAILNLIELSSYLLVFSRCTFLWCIAVCGQQSKHSQNNIKYNMFTIVYIFFADLEKPAEDVLKAPNGWLQIRYKSVKLCYFNRLFTSWRRVSLLINTSAQRLLYKLISNVGTSDDLWAFPWRRKPGLICAPTKHKRDSTLMGRPAENVASLSQQSSRFFSHN